MKKIFLLCPGWVPECDLSSLKEGGAELILITNESWYASLSENTKTIYGEIIVLEIFDFGSVLKAIKEHTINVSKNDIVILSNKEFTLLLAAEIREALAIEGDDIAYVKKFTDKAEMKKHLSSSDIALARFAVFSPDNYSNKGNYLSQIEKKLDGYPMFFKPEEGFGAVGTGVINNAEELQLWAQEHCNERFILEEFIEGTMYHFDSLVFNGEILFQAGAEYAWPCDQFFDGHPIGSIVLPFDSEIYQRLKRINEVVLQHMQPNNCATHMEFFRLASDNLIFVEVAARPPGGRIVDLYQRQWNINMELEHLKSQLGIKPLIELEPPSQYFAWAYIPLQAGEVKDLDMPMFLSHVNIDWYVEPGNVFLESHFDAKDIAFLKKYLAATVFIHNDNYEELMSDFNIIRNHQFVIYR